MCLTGENTGVKYRVGDVVTVQVAAVNLDEKKIDLAMQGGEQTKSGVHKSKKKTKDKKDKGSAKTKTNVPSKVKAKVKKRSARKKRPGKNARKSAKK